MNDKELEDRFNTISNRFSELLEVRRQIEDVKDDLEIETAFRKKVQENLESFRKQHKEEVIGVGKQISEGLLDIDRSMDKFRTEIKELRAIKDNLFGSFNKTHENISTFQEELKNIKEAIATLQKDVVKNNLKS